MEPTRISHWEPGHPCDLCRQPATMLRAEDQEWLCSKCYILTHLLRVKQIDDPSTVRGLANWLADRSETRHLQ